MAFHHRKFVLLEKIDEEPCPPPPPPPPRNHQISTVLIISICILAAAFLLISYYTLRRFRSRRRNSNHTQPQDNNLREDFVDEFQRPVIDHPIWYIRTIGLSQSVIDSISIIQYKKGEELMEGSDCAVCLSEFEEDERVKVLPNCRHGFHVECIDTWLRDHKNCPVCRAPVVIGGASRASSVETSFREEHRVESEDEREDSGEIRDRRLRVLSDLGDNRVKLDREMEIARRSISLDLSTAAPP